MSFGRTLNRLTRRLAGVELVRVKDGPERSGIPDLDYADSPVAALATPEDTPHHVAILRASLAADEEARRAGRLATPEARAIAAFGWYQRIPIPALGIHTTSDHAAADDHDPGDLHTLYGALSRREGTILRPEPKWLYLEGRLPDLRGKSVLEIGSSCGFFAFKFAELGAARVTGIEIIPEQVEAARGLAVRLGHADRVTFRQADAFYDRLEPHDVVFTSEVQGHSIVPFHSFLRCLGLARETLVIDDYFGWDDTTTGQLRLVGDGTREGVAWTGHALSEHNILKLCHLAGVPPRNVRRYRDGRTADNHHTLLVIDVTGAAARREVVLKHPSLRSMVELAMGLRLPVDRG